MPPRPIVLFGLFALSVLLATARLRAQGLRPERIEAPSLASNLLGDESMVDIFVHLPPSYGAGDHRYPVIYFLFGYGESANHGYGEALDEAYAAREIPESIVVFVSGCNRLGGAFYADSPVTGGWEQFVTRTLVAHVDTTYRTLAGRESRGIAGHSMGGFGCLDIAMRHPGLFSACYSMSPGLFADDGLAQSQMFRDGGTEEPMLALLGHLAPLPAEEARKAYLDFLDKCDDGALRFTLAYGSAFAPDPGRAPYIRYPFRRVDGRLVRDDEAWRQFDSGFGTVREEIAAQAGALRQYASLTLDCGYDDDYRWIVDGTLHYAGVLREAGIPHNLVLHSGGHEDRTLIQFRRSLLPTMLAHLAAVPRTH